MRSLSTALVLLLTASATAQPGWRLGPASERAAVALDVTTPLDGQRFVVTNENGEFVGEADSHALSSALALSASVPLSPSLSVEAQLPLAFVSFSDPGLTVDGTSGSDAEVGVGNPYVGVAWAAARAVTVEGGVRLPLASGDYFVGPGSVWVQAMPEQREAFEQDLASVRAGVRLRQQVGRGVSVEASGAGVYGVTTEEYVISLGPDSELTTRFEHLTATYGLLATGRLGRVDLAGGVVGSVTVDGVDDYRYPETTSLVAGAGVALGGPARARLGVRTDLQQRFNNTSVGLGVAVSL